MFGFAKIEGDPKVLQSLGLLANLAVLLVDSFESLSPKNTLPLKLHFVGVLPIDRLVMSRSLHFPCVHFAEELQQDLFSGVACGFCHLGLL